MAEIASFNVVDFLIVLFYTLRNFPFSIFFVQSGRNKTALVVDMSIVDVPGLIVKKK